MSDYLTTENYLIFNEFEIFRKNWEYRFFLYVQWQRLQKCDGILHVWTKRSEMLLTISEVLTVVLLKIQIFWIWRHDVRRVVTDVSNDRNTIIFSCSGTKRYGKLRHYSLSKCRELHAQIHGVTIQKAWIIWKSPCSRMLPGSSLRVECLISFQTGENLEY
jgi:hypothetical protein